ncbi:MAG: hypothetical protein AAFR47_02535 [Pseudomonadota bacterium]
MMLRGTPMAASVILRLSMIGLSEFLLWAERGSDGVNAVLERGGVPDQRAAHHGLTVGHMS